MNSVTAPVPLDMPLLDMIDVYKDFPVHGRGLTRAKLRAVNGVSVSINVGETLGLVGESGSGKSTVANLVTGLASPTSGTITVAGFDVRTLRGREQREHRRHVQMVFQDPYGSIAPTVTIEGTLAEPFRAHKMGDKAWRAKRVDELLDQVGLDRSLKHRFPSEMSGGQLQRVSIARALALEPKLVVLDEPVSALDVSTKADIINLLADLKASLGLAYLFISHDLSTLRVLTDRVAVMYLGEIVEEGPSDDIYESPRHPYTKALLAAVPVPDPVAQRLRIKVPIEGDIPSPMNAPPGCRFHTRCPNVMPHCREVVPQQVIVGGTRVSCHLYSSAAVVPTAMA